MRAGDGSPPVLQERNFIPQRFLPASKKRKEPAGTGPFQKLAITFSTTSSKKRGYEIALSSSAVENILTNTNHFVKMFFHVPPKGLRLAAF